MNKIDIIFATKNSGKVEELEKLFIENNLNNINILSLYDLQNLPEIIEDGKTFYENAFKKADIIFKQYKVPVLSDDSGLIVEALNEPGVLSARFAGINATDEENNLKLIKKVRQLDNRKAFFECSLVFINENEEIFHANGKCYGEIIIEPRGSYGFGYDPIFFLPELNKTMAELSLEEKNKISHRGKAFKKLVNILRGLYG